MTHLIVLVVLGLEADSSVEGEQETDTVCLDLKTLEYSSKKGAWGLGWYVSQSREMEGLWTYSTR